ncbi:3'-5' exonuclease [Halalkalibacter alkalisediminis]|uniref:PolC-type DNA polymerase III n=1 Tax=Halalkalibacter alkalisediminis TaxID=935616 RepID=A0ABV6NK59_9BACI|nr:3'-5' exonuclease [Halalkalibacter alkalisediminis]
MFWRKSFVPTAQTNKDIPLNTPATNLTFTVFDTETTGFAVGSQDRIIEIGACQVKNGKVQEKTFQTYVNPKRDIPPEITELTGISNVTVEQAPHSLEAIQDFFQYVEEGQGDIWLGHYASFDLLAIKKEIQRHQYRIDFPICLDTLDLIGYLSPAQHMLDLEIYASQFGSRIYDRHQALGDALTTAHLFCELLYHLEERGKTTLFDLMEISRITKRHTLF